MGIRTAIEHNALVAFGLLFAIAWTVLVGLVVVTQMGTPTLGDWVGPHGFGGVMGLLVLGVFLGLLVLAFGSLGEATPAPQEWPPE